MLDAIRRELVFPQARPHVWEALTDPAALSEWMFPNDFEAKAGRAFAFHVPPKPDQNFEGLTVRGEVTTCVPHEELEFTWVAGELKTRIRYRLTDEGAGTRVHFEQSGFVTGQEGARAGAEYGWGAMLGQLAALLERRGQAEA
jgi:uncharacterized protein YndB with AHSA1/START domain